MSDTEFNSTGEGIMNQTRNQIKSTQDTIDRINDQVAKTNKYLAELTAYQEKLSKHLSGLCTATVTTKTQWGGNIQYNRTGANLFVVSCAGNMHQDLQNVENCLLEQGCLYDYSKGVQEFRVTGRTYTHFIDPFKTV
jgi:hypothetical protein